MNVPADNVTAARWQRVKTILAEALERPSSEDRTAYLERSCGGDTTLMREVEALLAQATRNLDELAVNTPIAFARHALAQPPGRRIGAYEIVRELGRGGMGAVYLAKRADGQFEKEVAIKLLKRGTDTDEILRRFHAERRILAQLDHPNIARLLDAGTTDEGLPYFVMEYVVGSPITHYVRDHKLTITQRLQLFLKVCGAVQFAHQNLVGHRDLKPGNIIVTAEGEPKLLDFGIAKILASGEDAMELTLTAERRFTPVCASPEQARGEPVTAASDVYALGALLYELLSDQAPHRFSTPCPSSEELIRVIGQQEPLRPSLAAKDNEMRRRLRGDLDNIVLLALRKEPTRRYTSVKDFADDVRRHLDGRPVRARPNTLGYVSRRFLSRHKYPVIAGVLMAVLFLSFGLLLRWYPNALHQPEQLGGEDAGKSIAVLPFQVLGDDKKSALFADNLQQEIVTDLGRIADLKVISRESMTQYRGDPDVREVGRALKVAHVLQGSVQKESDRIRLNARLTDTRTGQQLWAEQFERDMHDLFAIESELTQKVAAQLKANFSAAEKTAIEEQPTRDVEAYNLFLQARAFVYQFSVPSYQQNLLNALPLLDEAIARDPKFTLAHALLSETHLELYRRYDHTPERLAKIKTAADA